MTDDKEKQITDYIPGPLENVKSQDALIIIAIYASQLDYKNCETEIKQLESILEKYPEFVAKKNDIFAMINKYINEMDAGDPETALSVAAKALSGDQKITAFELAVKAALRDTDLTEDKKKIIDSIKTRLSISDKDAETELNKYT